ncbi:oxepin-CoA hydrolase, alternative type [Paracoccus albus]|uniref:oxepin-CoA hydrolase, alternative type n=1 Tax=Paracoccus albus TaxID=3017784 RepID=UPI0022F0E387|nr:enoyl-CoA hydratase family protein [Paracoccus albus]WBU59223.1 enoyl-CoA hydratase family protein [Paracoccus albus]
MNDAAIQLQPQHAVLSECVGPTLVLTLNTPKKRNALSPGTYSGLLRGLDHAIATPEIANIVIQGANGFFCAGGDLDALATRAALPEAERAERIEQLHDLVRRIRRCPKPVIAAVEGGAAGAGTSIALAADLIVATHQSYLSMSYVKVGLVPDGGGTASLLRNLSPQLATEIALLGEKYPARRLAHLGVINRLVAHGQALDVALDLASKLARGAQGAQSSILALLDTADEGPFDDQLDREKYAMAKALGSADAAEGIAAFQQRRVPAFPKQPKMADQRRPTVETSITRLFGTELPIVAGGLMWLANADYVAAAARAGIIGFITAASFPEPDTLRAEIRRCRELAGARPFGVNISMLPKLIEGDRTADIFRLVAEEGVRFIETAGRSPEAYLPIARDAGIKVLHKSASLRHAVKAQEIGVDAVSIVGAECGGHPGLDMIGSFVNAGMADTRLSIPWLIGGGVGNGAQIAAILAMGGSGAVIGTRFLVADEIWAHDGYKQALIAATENDTALGMHTIRNTIRALANDTMADLRDLETARPDAGLDALMPLISGKIGRAAYESGDVSRGVLSAGQSLGMTNRTAPLAEIVGQLRTEMIEALNRAASYRVI